MMALVRCVVGAGLVALVTADCGEVVGLAPLLSNDGPSAGLRTDRTEYVARYVSGEGAYRQYGFVVVATFENSFGRPVYLARCYPTSPGPTYGVHLADEGGDPWGSGYNRAWACVGHENQILVPPGETRSDTLHLVGPNAWDGVTKQPFGTLAGRMRLVYEVQTCPGDGECRLPDAGRSNVFTVRHEP